MSRVTLLWQTGENPNYRKVRRPPYAALRTSFSSSAVRKQKATPSLETTPTGHDRARRNLAPGTEVDPTVLRLLEHITEGMIDDDAALLIATEAWGDPLAIATSLSVETAAGGDPRAPKRPSFTGEKRIQRFQTERTSHCVPALPKAPSCEV